MDPSKSPPPRDDLLKDLGYSPRSIDFIVNERNLGRPESFTQQTSHIGACGDMLRLYLDVEGDRITKARYELTGCAGLQACASSLTTLIEGMTLDHAKKLDVAQIVGFLGGIPAAKMDCAELARDTLRKAIVEVEGAAGA